MKKIGTVDIVAARVPGVEIDASEVDDPEKSREILDHRKVDDVAGVVLDRAGLDPLRMRLGNPLHVEKVPVGSVGVAFHHHRPVDEMRNEES
jgi:hypothetical protein